MRYLSVCSGIEAATQAWHPLGWTPVAFSEIEPFPSAVLANHYPHVPNWGDMTKFEDWPDEPIDLLCGGTPCQDYSVAGQRLGMAGARGQLTLTFVEIAARYRPDWLVWENVPGVLSSNGGRDFARFLGELTGQSIEAPDGGWSNSGIVSGVGDAYGISYRVLDAQYIRTRRFPFAVPQRRRRVWVVGYLGDWRRAAAVLFDRESLSGHPAPRREAGKRPAAGITASTGGCSGKDDPAGRVICANSGDVGYCLTASSQNSLDAETETLMVTPHPITLMQRGRDDGPSIERRQDGTANPLLTPNGGRAGMGVGCVAAPVAFDLTQITSAANRSIPQPVSPTMAKASNLHAVMPWAVRRLTPRECERLQGFPDDFTAIPWRKKPEDQCPDGPRYRALGNSMAVNCMEWLGERIQLVDTIQSLDQTQPNPCEASHMPATQVNDGPRMSIPRFADSPADVLRRAISRAAEHHGVTVDEIKGRSRLGPVAAARQDAFLALRQAGWSFPRIGRAMGRDHSTVMHGVARARSMGSSK